MPKKSGYNEFFKKPNLPKVLPQKVARKGKQRKKEKGRKEQHIKGNKERKKNKGGDTEDSKNNKKRLKGENEGRKKKKKNIVKSMQS